MSGNSLFTVLNIKTSLSLYAFYDPWLLLRKDKEEYICIQINYTLQVQTNMCNLRLVHTAFTDLLN